MGIHEDCTRCKGQCGDGVDRGELCRDCLTKEIANLKAQLAEKEKAYRTLGDDHRLLQVKNAERGLDLKTLHAQLKSAREALGKISTNTSKKPLDWKELCIKQQMIAANALATLEGRET